MIPVRDHIPTARWPVVTWLLVAVNVLVFLVERWFVSLSGDPLAVAVAFGVVPRTALADPVSGALHLASSLFSHDPTGWGHLAGNMLFLWIFGDNVEDALGRPRYLLLYLGSGVLAGAAQIAIGPHSAVPLLGASGAISGVLAAYALLYPRAPITVLNPVLPLWLVFGPFFELPAWLVVGEYFVVNVVSALGAAGGGRGGVAFAAHVAGFVTGALLLLALRGRRPRRDHDPWDGWRSRPRPRRAVPFDRDGDF
jgi:membrane associated rhomboid family serine protease